ncbi:MAG: thioredoxin family protein [Erysipelotrichaceae bacterium]|nr:thioredoxin family protein [Erysipelotrichaceae bacterium]
MKKRVLIITILLFSLFAMTACDGQKEKKTSQVDAERFKEEYESLNGTIRAKDGKTIRTIEISEDNPMIYAEATDIVQMMKDKKSFVVYFGFSDCPWCRSAVPTLIEVASDLGLDTIYYVDVKEIRDTMKIDESGNVVTETKGTDSYYDLLEAFDNVLSNYTLIDQDGNEISTGEKRIYAPNIISVVDGVATELTDGISDKQNDGYMELTSEMKQESYDKIECSIQCVVDDKKTCTAKASC